MRILLMCISVLAWGQDLIVQAVPISNRTPEAIQSWRVQLDWTVFGDPGQSFSVSFPTGDVAQARSLGATTRPSGVKKPSMRDNVVMPSVCVTLLQVA